MDDFELPEWQAKTEIRNKLRTKLFLESLSIRTTVIKNNTFTILGNLDSYDLPKIGELQRIRTQTQINLVSILLKMVSIHGKIDELLISTYTFNREALNIVDDLVAAGKIESIFLFLTSSMDFRDKAQKERIIRTAKKWKIPTRLAFAWLHWKITLAKCGENYYQHDGSMNYSTNNMAENITFGNDKSQYSADYELIDQVMMKNDTKALEIVL